MLVGEIYELKWLVKQKLSFRQFVCTKASNIQVGEIDPQSSLGQGLNVKERNGLEESVMEKWKKYKQTANGMFKENDLSINQKMSQMLIHSDIEVKTSNCQSKGY